MNFYKTLQNKYNMMTNEIDGTDANGNYYYDPLHLYQPIRRCGNDVYFYADVDQYSQLCLIQLLTDIQSDIISRNAERILSGSCQEVITIHINSCGGYLSSGLALYDYIRNMKVPTVGIVEGMAMSAASLILLACDQRMMLDNSTVLIHQLSTIIAGTYANLADQMINVEFAMDKLRKIYLEETTIGMPANCNCGHCHSEPIGEEDPEYEHRVMVLDSLLSHDLELDKTQCLKYGIVDPETEELCLTEEDNEEISKFIEKVANKRLQTIKKAEKEETKTKTKTTSTKSKSNTKKKE